MKTLLAVAALVLLLMTIGGQAQDNPEPDEPTKVGDIFAPLIRSLKDIAAALETAMLPVCADLDHANLRASSLDDAVIDGVVFCREIARDSHYRINPGALGSQRLIERGVRQAYDVFGLTEAGVAVQRFDHAISVCLKGRGDLVFLPAFASPRPAQSPQSYTSGEFTCTRIGSPGILALVNN